MTRLLALITLLGLGSTTVQLPDPVPPPEPLRVRVDLPDLVPEGMVVPFTVALSNPGDRPIPVELRGMPVAFDLVVRSEDDRLVWRRLRGWPSATAAITRTLQPGEVLTFDGRWDQRDDEGEPVPPGIYFVQGVLPVADEAGGWGSASRELTITP